MSTFDLLNCLVGVRGKRIVHTVLLQFPTPYKLQSLGNQQLPQDEASFMARRAVLEQVAQLGYPAQGVIHTGSIVLLAGQGADGADVGAVPGGDAGLPRRPRPEALPLQGRPPPRPPHAPPAQRSAGSAFSSTLSPTGWTIRSHP